MTGDEHTDSLQTLILRMEGERAVLVKLLIEADKVLSTLESEDTAEAEQLEQLRTAIRRATAPHRPDEADLLSIREGLTHG